MLDHVYLLITVFPVLHFVNSPTVLSIKSKTQVAITLGWCATGIMTDPLKIKILNIQCAAQYMAPHPPSPPSMQFL